MNENMPIFLMSPPRLDWSLRGKANFKSQQGGVADACKARKEWSLLADAIVDAGGEVVVCPPHPEKNLTGMIYTAEAGEFFRTARGQPEFLLPNMAVAHRREEADWIEQFVQEKLGISTRRVDAKWEAQGDAIRGSSEHEIIHTYGVGTFQRTEQEAYQEIAHLLSVRHIHVRFHADPWFHGNTFLQIFRRHAEADALCLVCPDALASGDLARIREFFEQPTTIVEISTEESQGYDTNSVQVNNRVIAPQTLSQTARNALIDFNFDIHTLDLSELFLKGGGAPVCLTNRMWGLTLAELPESVRWSVQPSIEAHCNV